jgi:hypothetical protein
MRCPQRVADGSFSAMAWSKKIAAPLYSDRRETAFFNFIKPVL